MSQKALLLGLFFPTSGNSSLRSLLKKLLLVASWFDADLHLLVPQSMRKKLDIELDFVLHRDSAKLVVESLAAKDYLQEAMSATQALSPDYLCFEDGDIGSSRTHLGRLKQSLLEQATAPILILPKRLPRKLPHLDSIIVPISGEQRSSEALGIALKIADTTQTSVTLVHVRPPGVIGGSEASGLESVGDQIQHEYAHQLDKVVSEASPKSGLLARQRVTRFAHLAGTAPNAISKFVKQSPSNLLILEWKGVLVGGHAATLKSLLKKTNAPILIVKMAREARSKLKIGRDFKAA